jgi:hypothetical protein
MVWMLLQSRGEGWRATWTLFSNYNVGTVLIQWAVVLAILLGANRFLVRKSLRDEI